MTPSTLAVLLTTLLFLVLFLAVGYYVFFAEGKSSSTSRNGSRRRPSRPTQGTSPSQMARTRRPIFPFFIAGRVGGQGIETVGDEENRIIGHGPPPARPSRAWVRSRHSRGSVQGGDPGSPRIDGGSRRTDRNDSSGRSPTVAARRPSATGSRRGSSRSSRVPDRQSEMEESERDGNPTRSPSHDGREREREVVVVEEPSGSGTGEGSRQLGSSRGRNGSERGKNPTPAASVHGSARGSEVIEVTELYDGRPPMRGSGAPRRRGHSDEGRSPTPGPSRQGLERGGEVIEVVEEHSGSSIAEGQSERGENMWRRYRNERGRRGGSRLRPRRRDDEGEANDRPTIHQQSSDSSTLEASYAGSGRRFDVSDESSSSAQNEEISRSHSSGSGSATLTSDGRGGGVSVSPGDRDTGAGRGVQGNNRGIRRDRDGSDLGRANPEGGPRDGERGGRRRGLADLMGGPDFFWGHVRGQASERGGNGRGSEGGDRW